MDIKTKINNLTETEAKAVLEWYVNKLSILQAVYQESCRGKVIDMAALQESTLDKALKEI